ncbi:MAG: hypothetical protein QXN95_05685 [Candidatus Bathyarchaeia archaeon]
MACPKCGSETLKHSHRDDIGNEWFRCEKCGEYCTHPKSKERKKLETALANTINAETIHLI